MDEWNAVHAKINSFLIRKTVHCSGDRVILKLNSLEIPVEKSFLVHFLDSERRIFLSLKKCQIQLFLWVLKDTHANYSTG